MSDETGQVLKYPFSDGTTLEVEPEYESLRKTAPVTRVELPYAGEAWLATRMQENRKILSDPRFSRAALEDPAVPRFTPEPIVGGLGTMDPPEHTRRRKLLGRAFTGRRVEQWRDRIREIVSGLLDDMERKGKPADFVVDFAFAVPSMVMCEVLGIPYSQRHRFERFLNAVASTSEDRTEKVTEAWTNLTAYFSELIAERRREPSDDLLSDMIQAQEGGDRFTDTEVIDNAIGVLAAGYETTGSEITNMTYTLLQHPDQWEILKDRPEIVTHAVEELLRYIPLSSIGGIPYVATEDVELDNVVIRAGEAVVPCTVSANRDENAFDDPDRLDVTRPAPAHLTFGHGVHYCVGAALARVMLQEAIGALANRFPGLRIAVPDNELKRRHGLVVRGFESLPITW